MYRTIIVISLFLNSCISFSNSNNADHNNSLELPNSTTITKDDLMYSGYYIHIDKIVSYDYQNKSTKSNIIENRDTYLFQIGDNDDWLFCVYDDLSYSGWINIYDLSRNSFYGNIDEKKKSDNYYYSSLVIEYNLTLNSNKYFRHGPLLLIKNNGKIIKIFDSFKICPSGCWMNLLVKEIDDNNIVIYRQFWEGGDFRIFNLNTSKYSLPMVGIPVFNEDNNYFYCTGVTYNQDLKIQIFKYENGLVEKINVFSPQLIPHDEIINTKWLSNKAFVITFKSSRIILVEKENNDWSIKDSHITSSNNGLPATAHTRLRPNWHMLQSGCLVQLL
jgi:hypothetical protein